MVFTIFLPGNLYSHYFAENASEKGSEESVSSNMTKLPVIYYLSGLTCTDENVIQKGFAHHFASKRNVCVVAPDTSPRGANIEGEDESWDFGTGAGFYLDATADKWKNNYRMYTYITSELPTLLQTAFGNFINIEKASIMGHSMGGHGALTIGMKNPTKYKSVSAFAPICHPINCPWGKKAFSNYLGSEDEEAWKEYDATCLMSERGPFPWKILVDQGGGDDFLTGGQLQPEALEKVMAEKKQEGSVEIHADYDHSYFFISSFMEKHVNFHADALLEN